MAAHHGSQFAFGPIRSGGEAGNQLDEFLPLADEQPVPDEASDRGDSTSPGVAVGRTIEQAGSFLLMNCDRAAVVEKGLLGTAHASKSRFI